MTPPDVAALLHDAVVQATPAVRHSASTCGTTDAGPCHIDEGAGHHQLSHAVVPCAASCAGVRLSTALVPVDRRTCPACGSPSSYITLAQPALLRHGGYGEVRITRLRHCWSCDWTLVAGVSSGRPSR